MRKGFPKTGNPCGERFAHKWAKGGNGMSIDEIERAVQAIRAKPLQLIGITPTGERCIMSVRQCVKSKAKYLHIVADELDELLGAALGGDSEYP